MDRLKAIMDRQSHNGPGVITVLYWYKPVYFIHINTYWLIAPVKRPPLFHYRNCMHIAGWFSHSIQSTICMIYQSWWISGTGYVYYAHNTASSNNLTRTITRMDKLYEKLEYFLSGFIHVRSKHVRLRI